MADHVRWGVLGASRFALNVMAPAIHAGRRGALAAMASRHPEKAAPAQASAPGLVVHDSYEALLDDPEIDAIYIPLPNHLHVEWAERALRAGKHVLCEKPLAMRAEEIDRLIALRDETGLVAAEAFMVAHHPQWTRVRALIGEGAIGRLRHVQGVFTYYNVDPDNIRNRADAGGGALRDIGVYPLVTARLVVGEEPTEAVAEGEWENGVDTVARARLKFPSCPFDFYVSMRMRARQEMVFHGEKGAIIVRAPFNAGLFRTHSLELWREDGTESVEYYAGVNHYEIQVDAFNEAVQGGAPYPCTLEFSRGNQAALDRLIESAGPAAD